MFSKFDSDIMNVNNMHEAQKGNFDYFEKEEMHLNMSPKTYKVLMGLAVIVVVVLVVSMIVLNM